MGVQVLTRDYGYVGFASGDSFTIADGLLTVYDEGTEAIGAFSQWIGILKTETPAP